MIYMRGTRGDGQSLRIVVLETANLEKLKAGGTVTTPDKEVLICWTPDMVWLADKLADTKGDAAAVAALIAEAAKRPQKPLDRPPHPTHVKDFAAERGEAPKAFEVRSSHGRGWIVGDAPECEKFDYRTEAELYASLRREGETHFAAWNKVRDSVITPRKLREAETERRKKGGNGGQGEGTLGGEG